MKPMEASDDRYTLNFQNNTVYLAGDIDVKDPQRVLGKFLMTLHEQIKEDKLSEINVNVQKLGFINSIGIKEITRWVLLVDELEMENKYIINFILQANLQWQQLTFTSIKWLNEKYIKLIEKDD